MKEEKQLKFYYDEVRVTTSKYVRDFSIEHWISKSSKDMISSRFIIQKTLYNV